MASGKSVFDIIERDEKFSVLLKLLVESGLSSLLRDARRTFTFFAPTDGAFYSFFRQYEKRTVNLGKITIASILSQHIVPGAALYSRDIRRKNFLISLESTRLHVRLDEHLIFVNDAQIITAGTAAANGVLFAVDKVLLDV